MKLNFGIPAPERDNGRLLERRHERDRQFPLLEQSFTRAFGLAAVLTSLWKGRGDQTYVLIISPFLVWRMEFFR